MYTSGNILPDIQAYPDVTNSGTMLSTSGLTFLTGTSNYSLTTISQDLAAE